MIIRIATEAQYEISEDDREALNALDDEAKAALDADDEAGFRAAFAKLVDFVRTHGHEVPEDTLAPSDLILPPSDVSIEEAREEFKGEGLIPG